MVTFHNTWNNQKTWIDYLIITNMTYVSGKVYFSKWRTSDEFPHIQAYIVEDSPEIIRQSSTEALYRTNTRWRFIYRQETKGDPANSYLALQSGLGGLCNIFSEYQAYSTYWDYAVVDRVDFEYVSPDISPAVIDEGVVDVIFRSETSG